MILFRLSLFMSLMAIGLIIDLNLSNYDWWYWQSNGEEIAGVYHFILSISAFCAAIAIRLFSRKPILYYLDLLIYFGLITCLTEGFGNITSMNIMIVLILSTIFLYLYLSLNKSKT